ncbi:MAG: ABC transporter permease [Roseibacillus sp.]|nr:ABC transporter permease [Roseibacillus sp.]
MKNIWSIFCREVSSFFTSPLAYVLIFIFLVAVNALTFLWPGRELIESEQAALKDYFFFYHPWVLAFYGPLLAMRTLSDEHRQGTIELISTMPVRTIELVFGKFLGGFTVLFVSLLFTLSVVITVSILGNPDPGPLFAGYLGSLLVGGTFIAVTIAVSALTRSQVICVAVSIPICLLLCLIGFDPVQNFFADSGVNVLAAFGELLASISVMPGFTDFSKGLVDIRYLFYFLSVIALCLFITNTVLQSKRA